MERQDRRTSSGGGGYTPPPPTPAEIAAGKLSTLVGSIGTAISNIISIYNSSSKTKAAQKVSALSYESNGNAGQMDDPNKYWCRATINGTTYSHGGQCDDPNNRIESPKELKTILDTGENRISYVNDFFNNHKGTYYPNPSVSEIKINYGKDIVSFMQWETNSGRIPRSEWNFVNAQMIADIYWAQQPVISELSTPRERHWSENEIKWQEFANSPSQDKLWKAHNGSIFVGHDLAITQGYLNKETEAEQQFIKNVIFRVSLMEAEVNQTGLDIPSSMGIIGNLMNTPWFNYPLHYPATFDDPATKPLWDLPVPPYLQDLVPR